MSENHQHETADREGSAILVQVGFSLSVEVKAASPYGRCWEGHSGIASQRSCIRICGYSSMIESGIPAGTWLSRRATVHWVSAEALKCKYCMAHR